MLEHLQGIYARRAWDHVSGCMDLDFDTQAKSLNTTISEINNSIILSSKKYKKNHLKQFFL